MITDADLVERALSGGEQAYADLIARYERPVFTLVLRMVRDRTVAEDLAQDAFVKAFGRLASYDPSRKFSSWLFKVAHNTAIDHLRRRELATVSLDAPVGDDEDAPARTLADPAGETPEAAAERADVLGRPDHERPYVLIPVGYPVADCQVPAIERKPLSEVLVRV